jgi:hypothetical protein
MKTMFIQRYEEMKMKKSKTLLIASALLLGSGGMAVSSVALAYHDGDPVLRSLNLLLGGYNAPERVVVYRDIDRPRYRDSRRGRGWRGHHDRHDRGFRRWHHREHHWDRGFNHHR